MRGPDIIVRIVTDPETVAREARVARAASIADRLLAWHRRCSIGLAAVALALAGWRCFPALAAGAMN